MIVFVNGTSVVSGTEMYVVVAWAGHATYGTYLTWVAGLSGTPLPATMFSVTCFLLPGGLEHFPGSQVVFREFREFVPEVWSASRRSAEV